jgi:hypothetical protein
MFIRIAVAALAVVSLSGVLPAADGKLTHCFYFTAVDNATDADWQAWFKATDALPGKIPGLLSVSYGKLARPLTLFAPDAETRKKVTAEASKVNGDFNLARRQWGACMVFAGPDALKAYAAHPAHKEWDAVYGKVRVAGTTTLDFVSPK